MGIVMIINITSRNDMGRQHGNQNWDNLDPLSKSHTPLEFLSNGANFGRDKNYFKFWLRQLFVVTLGGHFVWQGLLSNERFCTSGMVFD